MKNADNSGVIEKVLASPIVTKPKKRRGRPAGAKNKKTKPAVDVKTVIQEEVSKSTDSSVDIASLPEEVDVDKFDNSEVIDLTGLSEEEDVSADLAEQKANRPPTTKPWADNVWQPDVFRLPKKHSGFTCKWTDPRKCEQRLYEGWVYAKASKYGIIKAEDSFAGKHTSQITRKGMILMELPNKLKDARTKYFSKRNTDRAQNVNKEIKGEAEELKKSLGHDIKVVEIHKPE